MTLTKAELTQTVVDGVGLNQREAKEMVDAFFSEISTCLAGCEDVKLSGFGTFETRDKAQRPGRNPVTGETVMVTARRGASSLFTQAIRSSKLLAVANVNLRHGDIYRR